MPPETRASGGGVCGLVGLGSSGLTDGILEFLGRSQGDGSPEERQSTIQTRQGCGQICSDDAFVRGRPPSIGVRTFRGGFAYCESEATTLEVLCGRFDGALPCRRVSPSGNQARPGGVNTTHSRSRTSTVLSAGRVCSPSRRTGSGSVDFSMPAKFTAGKVSSP